VCAGLGNKQGLAPSRSPPKRKEWDALKSMILRALIFDSSASKTSGKKELSWRSIIVDIR
jgi:hypothetical protein